MKLHVPGACADMIVGGDRQPILCVHYTAVSRLVKIYERVAAK